MPDEPAAETDRFSRQTCWKVVVSVTVLGVPMMSYTPTGPPRSSIVNWVPVETSVRAKMQKVKTLPMASATPGLCRRGECHGRHVAGRSASAFRFKHAGHSASKWWGHPK